MELTLPELAATAAAAVAAADVRVASGRVTEVPDERTIRWYSSIGLLDRPSGNRGRTSLYGERHVLQLIAIKRRQAEGRTLAEIQTELVGATDEALRRIADVPPVEPQPAPALLTDGVPRFWRERPAAQPHPDLLAGIDLGDGIVLVVPSQPDADDVHDIRAAAQPLLDLLAERRLTRRSPA